MVVEKTGACDTYTLLDVPENFPICVNCKYRNYHNKGSYCNHPNSHINYTNIVSGQIINPSWFTCRDMREREDNYSCGFLGKLFECV